MATANLGAAAFVYKGNWALGGGTGGNGAYKRMHVVRSNNSIWVAIVETEEEPTSASSEWALMLENADEQAVIALISPSISTGAITNITGVSASVAVNVQKFGFTVSPMVGVEYREQGQTAWLRTSTIAATALGNIPIPMSGLDLETAYEVRAFALDAKNPDIESFGEVQTFSTIGAFVETPILSISGYPDNIYTTPTLSTSAFSAVGLADTHLATTWRAKRADGTVVWESVANTTDKTSITIPYGYLQYNTTYSFEVIHIGQTLGASAVGSISAATAVIPPIGLAGSVGFGVGIAPNTLVTAFSLTPMTGYDDPTHANFGNYTDASGSVMVFIPKHYVKLSHDTAEPYFGLRVDVVGNPQTGYSLPRCFVNNGVVVAGIFVDKYLGGKEGTVMVSKRNLDPVSTHSTHNLITALTANGQAPTSNYEGMYAAVKTRGANYSLTTIFTYTMLANLADAHYQACYRNNNFAPCAWADIEPYQPKGNNSNTLKDANDANVVYTPSGFMSCGLTGGVSDVVFAKIAHNGQKCGVVDLNGNMWEVAAGYITSAAGAHLVLKESIDVKNLTAAEAYTTANYDALTMPLTLSDTQVAFGNGTNEFFSGDTVRTNNAYRLDNLGLPLNDNAISTSGTNRFGQDGFFRYQENEMCPIVGGHWHNSGMSGVRARDLYNVRSYSNYGVGGRACLVPSVAE